MNQAWLLSCLFVIPTVAGIACSRNEPAPARPVYAPLYGRPGEFKDSVKTNAQVASGDLDLVLKDTKGGSIDFKQYRGKKNLVVVVMRGYPGFICPNCSAQTSRLISNYPEFTKRDAEVVVLFPGPTEHLNDYIATSRRQASDQEMPFPIVLDENFAVVDRLGIRGDLAKPSTYIVDKQGQVRFAYVGANSADRPSLKAMLDQLDAIPKS
jgi:peroxiredoxin